MTVQDELLGEELRRSLLSLLAKESDLTDEAVRAVIEELLDKTPESAALGNRRRRQVAGQLFAAVRRMDVLQPLLDDPSVTEIMVNGPDHIFIERDGKLQKSSARFPDRERLGEVIRRIAGSVNRVINERSPIVDARLPDGSRVNAVIAPAALNGPILTIRRFPADPITMEDLIRMGTLTAEAAVFLSALVRTGYSILISGGTSSGKTTFLNALSAFIPAGERIITIEDTAELQIQGIDNIVRLEAKEANMEGSAEVPIRALIKSALRMRPDRIIVGEVRGGEAADLLTALNTGHDGSMSTIHANSAEDLFFRLETMVLMAHDLPPEAIRAQISSGVDLAVHLGRLPGRGRRVLEIAETCGTENGRILLNTLFSYAPKEDALVSRGTLQNKRKLLLSEDPHILPQDAEERKNAR